MYIHVFTHMVVQLIVGMRCWNLTQVWPEIDIPTICSAHILLVPCVQIQYNLIILYVIRMCVCVFLSLLVSCGSKFVAPETLSVMAPDGANFFGSPGSSKVGLSPHGFGSNLGTSTRAKRACPKNQ